MPLSPRQTCLALCLTASLAACSSSGFTLGGALVPAGGTVQLDGEMGEDEWREARSQPLTRDGSVAWMQRENALYIGVRGLPDGLGHVYLAQGDTIRVFHASGALGTATYARKGEAWEPSREFAWDVRGRQYTPALQAQQEAHYGREGWVASTTGMGVFTDMEFRISMDLLRQSDALAVAYGTGSGPDVVQHAPSGLADATVLPALLMGNVPGGLRFAPSQWLQVNTRR